MYNDIKIGPVTFHMYGIMIAIGFIAALIMCIKRGKKQGLNEDIIYGILYCAIIGGFLGCRLLYYIVEIPNIIKDPSILWDFKNGFVVYGGIIGGIIASFIYIRHKKEDFLKYFDLVMPAVALAQGFGRIGCFFAGCCYGAETDSRFHIVFKNSQFAPNNVQLVPTQVISSIGDFAIAALLVWYSHKTKVKGRVAAGYLVLYGIGRFLVEFLRDDYRGSIGIFSTSQIISVIVVIAGIILYIWAGKRNVTNMSEDKQKEDTEL